MSTDVRKYVPLRTVCAYSLDEADKSMGDFDKAWIFAFRAFVEIGMNIAWEPMTVRVPVDTGNMTARLPVGYIKWTKIGVVNASGEVSFLKVNRSLTTFRDLSPNRLTSIAPDITDQNLATYLNSPCFYNYYFGSAYSPYFGLGAGLVTYGDCVVDETNGLIILDPNYGFPDVLLEYIGSPEKNSDYQIPIECQEAVIAFILWKFKAGTEQSYYSRLTEARRKLKPITLQEIQQVIREGGKYSLKA